MRPVTSLQPHIGPDTDQPRYLPGDAVRAKQTSWPGHTRCPGYVMGRRGTVARVDADLWETYLEPA